MSNAKMQLFSTGATLGLAFMAALLPATLQAQSKPDTLQAVIMTPNASDQGTPTQSTDSTRATTTRAQGTLGQSLQIQMSIPNGGQVPQFMVVGKGGASIPLTIQMAPAKPVFSTGKPAKSDSSGVKADSVKADTAAKATQKP